MGRKKPILFFMKKFYKKLKTKFGDHSEAARAIGIHPRYYRSVRSGNRNPSERLIRLIKLTAK